MVCFVEYPYLRARGIIPQSEAVLVDFIHPLVDLKEILIATKKTAMCNLFSHLHVIKMITPVMVVVVVVLIAATTVFVHASAHKIFIRRLVVGKPLRSTVSRFRRPPVVTTVSQKLHGV